jgi:hypothetical protein
MIFGPQNSHFPGVLGASHHPLTVQRWQRRQRSTLCRVGCCSRHGKAAPWRPPWRTRNSMAYGLKCTLMTARKAYSMHNQKLCESGVSEMLKLAPNAHLNASTLPNIHRCRGSRSIFSIRKKNGSCFSSPQEAGGDKPTSEGNAELQDALADILDMEIRKSKVKEVVQDFHTDSQTLRVCSLLILSLVCNRTFWVIWKKGKKGSSR